VEYDFTADLEEKLDLISNEDLFWKDVLRDFWRDFAAAIDGTKDLRTSQVLDALNDLLGPHIFPARGDGGDPRQCPTCGTGPISSNTISRPISRRSSISFRTRTCSGRTCCAISGAISPPPSTARRICAPRRCSMR